MTDQTGCEVYRRRKSRNEPGDKNRVIGGLGRRRANPTSSNIQEKIHQFGNVDKAPDNISSESSNKVLLKVTENTPSESNQILSSRRVSSESSSSVLSHVTDNALSESNQTLPRRRISREVPSYKVLPQVTDDIPSECNHLLPKKLISGESLSKVLSQVTINELSKSNAILPRRRISSESSSKVLAHVTINELSQSNTKLPRRRISREVSPSKVLSQIADRNSDSLHPDSNQTEVTKLSPSITRNRSIKSKNIDEAVIEISVNHPAKSKPNCPELPGSSPLMSKIHDNENSTQENSSSRYQQSFKNSVTSDKQTSSQLRRGTVKKHTEERTKLENELTGAEKLRKNGNKSLSQLTRAHSLSTTKEIFQQNSTRHKVSMITDELANSHLRSKSFKDASKLSSENQRGSVIMLNHNKLNLHENKAAITAKQDLKTNHKQYTNSSSSENVSKINVLKNKLYEQSCTESSENDFKYRNKKQDSKNSSDEEKQITYYNKHSKIPMRDHNFNLETETSDILTEDKEVSHVETTPAYINRRTVKALSKTTSQITGKTLEINNFIKNNSTLFLDNEKDLSFMKDAEFPLNEEIELKFKNKNLSNTPGLSLRPIQSEGSVMSSLSTVQNTIKLNNDLKKASTLSSESKENDISAENSDKNDESATLTYVHQKVKSAASKIVLPNMTGVTNNQNKAHAENDLTKLSDSPKQKSRVNNNFLSDVTENQRKSSKFFPISNDKLNNSPDRTAEDHADTNNLKKSKTDKHTTYQKVTLDQRYNNRYSKRDRSIINTWVTTTDSEVSSSHSSESKHITKSSDSSSSSDVNLEEKESSRRRRLTKKRSKKGKTKSKLIPKDNRRDKSFDTSDGDILESNYTSDECDRSNDTDINSDGDDLVVDIQNNSITCSTTTAKLNTENLISQLSENNNNNSFILNYNSKEKETLERVESNIEIYSNVLNKNTMKSSSLTVVSMPNYTSFQTTDMMGTRSEDEGIKLSNWKKTKDGPLGSFNSISRVSTMKLQSFAGKSHFISMEKNHGLSKDKPLSTSSFSEISDAKLNNLKNPFGLKGLTINSSNERHSDGENIIEKNDELEGNLLQRSYTLPKNMRLKNFDVSKNPFSLMREQTDAEKEESARTAEVLNSLPDSPFSLLGRFTRDTERLIKSRSSGNIDNDLNNELSIDEEDESLNNIKINKTDLNKNNVVTESIVSKSNVNINTDDVTDVNIQFKNYGNEELKKTNIVRNNSKVRCRPQLKISSLNSENIDDDNYKQINDSPAPRRRPSYMIAQNFDDMGDPMTTLLSPTSPKLEENIDSSKKPIWSRPRVPGTLTASTDEKVNEDLSPTTLLAKGESDSDNDDILSLDINLVSKPDALNKIRSRAPLALPPLLAGIPEERGQRKNADEYGRSRKNRKPGLLVFPEDTIAEEPSREPDCDSPKTDERETGYHSQGSDLLSTPNKLSCEELSSEQDYEKYEELNEISNENIPTPSVTKAHIKNNLTLYPSIPNDNVDDVSATYGSISNKLLTSVSDTNLTKQVHQEKNKATLSTTSLQTNVNKLNNPDGEPIPLTPLTPDTPTGEKPLGKQKPPKHEMREHVLQNLLETERSYVTNLNSLMNMFFKPLKLVENAHIIDSSLVDKIFFQIPEILQYHELFLEQLTNRVNLWSDKQIIGDIFISSFTKCLLMDAYNSFISHFVQAKDAIRQATKAGSQFTKYIEQCYKEHREKLTLSDLLIMPVQRIPRYVLLLKDMLKYTPLDHPDYQNLQLAFSEIKTLADLLNKGEAEADQAEKDNERIRDIESTIEGITDLVTSNRKFIRQDLVAELSKGITKKDRCLFLFSDLLVCTTVRRRTNALRRGSLGLFTGQSAADLNRYKFVWKLPLENVDITKVNNAQTTASTKDIERLEEDMRILLVMSNHMETLSIPHNPIEISIKDAVVEVRSTIQDKQMQLSQTSLSPMLSKIELLIQLEERTEIYTFIFLSAECKSSWEAFFEDAKQKLSYSKGTFPPEFQYPMPITKTRSGMQFTCAAPSHNSNMSPDVITQSKICGDIWICNSDGYVGQVCLLSMIPIAESKASLSVCSSRIVCIAAVPGARVTNNSSNNTNSHDIMRNHLTRTPPRKLKTSKSSSSIKNKKNMQSDNDDVRYDDIVRGAETIIAFDSSDEAENDYGNVYLGSNPSPFGGRMSPDGSSLGTVESLEGGDHDSSDFSSSDEDHLDSSHPIRFNATPNSHNNNSNHYVKGDLDAYVVPNLDEQPTMWLGTEDRHIYVYRAQDAITQRKSKLKLQLSSPATALLYFENKVFVALGSGELCIYQRESSTNSWEISSPQTIHVSISNAPIVCITAVAGRIWCGCQNTVVLVNATTLKIETTISVSNDHNKTVHKVVSSGLGVWVSLQSSSVIRLYHATTYDNLADVDVAPAVHKMLAGADAIIRQHKAACLRVTSLLVCKDLLWIGTSAGVILTNPLPSITASTSVLRQSLGPSGSPHGHTGHVRFLTSVEVPESEFKILDIDKDSRTSPSPLSTKYKNRELKHNRCVDEAGVSILTLVVSGGDGYEDFRYNQQTDSVGRDDSTNHLLIWRV